MTSQTFGPHGGQGCLTQRGESATPVILQPGWYWARPSFRSRREPEWRPVYIAGDDPWILGIGPLAGYEGDIGPMLAEQGPGQPVLRFEVSVPKMEAFIREHMGKAMERMIVLPSDEEPEPAPAPAESNWSEAWGHSRIVDVGAERMQVREHDSEFMGIRFMRDGAWGPIRLCPMALWRAEGWLANADRTKREAAQ